MIKDTFPNVTGHVTIELKKDGKVVKTVEGKNIWTNTGRQFLADLIRYEVYNKTNAPTSYTSSTPKREDRVAYFGLGSGSQTAAVGITTMVDPVSFDPWQGSSKFLAFVDSSSQANEPSYTGVTFEREFATNELVDSSGGPIILTEIGLFTDGNQLNDFSVGIESINGINAVNGTTGFAPIAYKTFEPITKTTDYVLRITWQVRFS